LGGWGFQYIVRGFLYKAYSEFILFKGGSNELLKIQNSTCKDSIKDFEINNEDYLKLNVINNKGEKMLCLDNSAMKNIAK